MSIRVSQIKGVSEGLANQMKQNGIATSEQLVVAARTANDRKALSAKLNISAKELLEIANRADLARVKGIGAVFGDLLEKAGVDTVKEMATRKPENLHEKLVSLMAGSAAISRPSLQKVTDWVNQAKALGAGLEH